jgi:hypothetical protein
MSNTGSLNNKEVQRGKGRNRAWQSRGRGQARGLSNPPLKPMHQTTDGHAQQSEAKSTASDAQTTRQRMNLMASVSRSSGLQKDGDEWVFFLQIFNLAGVMIEH